MEYKDYPDQYGKLFECDAFADVPELNAKSGKKQPRDRVGDCFVDCTLQVSKEEYLTYLQQVLSAGWQECIVHTEPFHKVIYNAVFRKDRRVLIVAFYDFPTTFFVPNKLYITVAPVPDYRIIDSGDLFKDMAFLPKSDTRDCGEGHFIKVMPDAGRSDYESLLLALEKTGWKRQYDNGDGLAGSMFTARYAMDGRTLTALFAAPSRKLYVTAGRGKEQVSQYLFDDPNRRKSFVPGLKTSLHMLELWHFGNSFVIQLKNGHFIVNDGGTRSETPYLIEYMESLAPSGEKPVVEGWFISHLHYDHCGVLMELGSNEQWSGRIAVDGVYFSVPSIQMLALEQNALGIIQICRQLSRFVRTSSGEATPFYRLHTGERYYFADITVDVLLSQELLPYEDCSGDLNDTSTWLLFTIERQKVLLAGDGDRGGMKLLMDNYTSEYMTVDVMGLLHHGWNTRRDFTDYCRSKTVLFTCYRSGPTQNEQQNEYLKTKIEEWFPWGDGTRVLTFPYRVGESVCRPHFTWKYNLGEPRPGMPNTDEQR